MTHEAEKNWKTLQREAQAYVEARNDLEDEVVVLRVSFHDSLQKAI